MRSVVVLLVGILSLACGACRTTVIAYETPQRYRNLMDQGAEPVEEFNETAATLLNVFPGLGDVYTERPMIGLANALFWPWSVVWAAPNAGDRARRLNEQFTVDYYMTGEGAGQYDPDKQAPQGPGARRAAKPAVLRQPVEPSAEE